MKKICFFLTDASDEGGIQRVITELANYFCDELDITIVSIFYRENKKIESLPYKLKNNVKFEGFIDKSSINNRYLKRMQIILAIGKLHNFLRNEKFAVLIANGMESVIWSFLPASLLNLKYICCDHTSFDRTPLWARVGRKLSLLFADAIVVLTSSDSRRWNNKKVNIIPNPSPYTDNVRVSSYIKRNPRIIAVGRLVQVKGFDRLLNIWEKFIRANPDAPYHLQIIGNGPLKDELNTRIKNARIEKVSISEFTSDIDNIYNDSQLILMTSYHEGLAMVLIEAQAFGIPALAYNVSGPSEVIIDAKTGYLIEDGNEDAFVRKLSFLLTDHNVRNEMSKDCSNFVHRFDMKEIAKKWKRLFEA